MCVFFSYLLVFFHRIHWEVIMKENKEIDIQYEWNEKIKKLANDKKIAILVSSHNLAEMELMCDTVGIINLGNLDRVESMNKKDKTSDEQVSIQVNFPNYAGKLILENFGKRKLSIIKNTLIVDIPHENIPEITALLVKNGIAIFSIVERKQNLESIFLETINKRTLPSPKVN